MADKYINSVGIQTIKAWIEGKFALDSDLDTLSGRVDDIEDIGGEPNVIDVIKVNGTTQTVTNKEVDLTVPTKVSDLTNDSNFQTDAEVEAAINAKVTSVYVVKGTVATVADLPSTNNKVGDVWDVQENGVNYVWTGTAWDPLGSYVDTSVLWTSVSGQNNTLEPMTVAEINAILNPTTP